MESPIKQIVLFNQRAGLLDKGYDDFLESSFQIEEALEGFDLNSFGDTDIPFDETEDGPKELSRQIVKLAMNSGNENISDVDRLDKACDAVVYAVGSMAKLGLNAQQITKALNIVMKANNAKLGCPKDEYGKLMKPDNFPNPEPELQKLLDSR